MTRWRLMIHGGAGSMHPHSLDPEAEQHARAGLEAALRAGASILDRQESAVDAVEAAVRALEEDSCFNAGRGSVLNVLWLDGENVTQRPLTERRALLDRLRLRPPLVRVLPLRGAKPWDRACEQGWEGVIAKRLDSPYQHKRSRLWLKMKCEASQELVIGGFTDPRGKRAGLGALLVGYFEGDDFVFAGKVGTGLDTRLLNALRSRLDRLERSRTPFTKGTGLPKNGVHWVRPQLVIQVAFMEWTGHGKMRHPRLLGLRADKAARDVIREVK